MAHLKAEISMFLDVTWRSLIDKYQLFLPASILREEQKILRYSGSLCSVIWIFRRFRKGYRFYTLRQDVQEVSFPLWYLDLENESDSWNVCSEQILIAQQTGRANVAIIPRQKLETSNSLLFRNAGL